MTGNQLSLQDHPNPVTTGARDQVLVGRRAVGPEHAARSLDVSLDGNTALTALRVRARAGRARRLRERGRLDDAERIYLEALRDAERTLGFESRDVGLPLNDLGVVYKAAGRFDEAEAHYRRALPIFVDGPEEASVWHNLSGIEHARGRPHAGEPHARRAVELRRDRLGNHHSDVAADVAALAALVQQQGRLDEAEAMYREALATFEAAFGREHYSTRAPHASSAPSALPITPISPSRCTTSRRSTHGSAEPPTRRAALAIFRRALGDAHPNTRRCVRALERHEGGRSPGREA